MMLSFGMLVQKYTSICGGFVKDNKVNISRALFMSYGALFAVGMQQNGVHMQCLWRHEP